MKKQTPENLVKQQIKDQLGIKGWFLYYNLQGIGCYPGVCDFVACKKKIVLFIEAKSEKGKLNDAQKEFKRNIEEQDCNFIEARGYKDIENYLKKLESEDEK